jgi:hypothetical protein
VRLALTPGFSTYNIPATTTNNGQHIVTLASGEHAKIVLPTSQARVGGVRIQGTGGTNNRIWIIGGQIKSHPTAATDCLNLAGIDHSYVEGVWLNKAHAVGSACAFATRNNITGVASAGSVWMQNCLITGVNYMDTGDGDFQTEHGDLWIFQHPAVRFRVYRFTGWPWNTSFITSGAFSDGAEFYDTNINFYDSRFNPKQEIYGTSVALGNSPSHSVLSSISCAHGSRFTFDNFYWHDDQPVGNFPITDSNGTTTHTKRTLANMAPLATSCITASGDPYTGTLQLTLPGGVTGLIRGGIPPNGNFVNSGTLSYGSQQWPNATAPTHTGNFDGLNYPQPGTAGHPGYLE